MKGMSIPGKVSQILEFAFFFFFLISFCSCFTFQQLEDLLG